MQPPSTPLVNWLRREIKHKNSPIVLFTGRPRSGKTFFAMRCAWELYPDKFDFTHVVKDIKEFAELFKKLDNDIIILDEASSSLYVYDWNSIYQRVFSIINDTQAYKHILVFIILPQAIELGKLQRYKVDAVVETHRFGNDKVFYKYLIHMKRYSDLSMRPPILKLIAENIGPIPSPPDHIVKPYLEQQQTQFKSSILEAQITAMNKKFNPQVQRPQYGKLLTPSLKVFPKL